MTRHNFCINKINLNKLFALIFFAILNKKLNKLNLNP